MNIPTIHCPECNTEITLSETLAADHIEAERVLHRKAISEVKAAYDSKADAVAERERKLAQAESKMQETIAAESDRLKQQIEMAVRRDMQTQLTSVEQRLSEKDQQLKQAESLELESRKRMAEADEKLRQSELDVQRQLDEERKSLIEASAKHEQALKADIARREAAIAESEKQIEQTLAAERTKLAEQIQIQVRDDMNARITDTEKRLAEKDELLKQTEVLELESRKRMTDADEKVRQAELQVQRRLDEERAAIREKALNESGEESQKKIAEKDQVIEQMNKRIELLARQADSKSQQLQGDLEEQNIFNRLREHFPADELVRIPRGRNGADIVFKIKTPSGRVAGTVLIEVKDTQNFDNKWIGKLKSDTHDQNADIGVIVSRAMPADIELMEQRDDIWICRADVLVPLMTALRNEIQHVSRIRSTTELSEATKDIVFDYLTSADFTRRVTSMVDGYDSLRSSLDKQKRQFNQRMSEQERALDNLIAGISGVYGDLSQLAGPSLKPVAGLELDDSIEVDDSILKLADAANTDVRVA